MSGYQMIIINQTQEVMRRHVMNFLTYRPTVFFKCLKNRGDLNFSSAFSEYSRNSLCYHHQIALKPCFMNISVCR